MHRGYVKLWRKFKDSGLWRERRVFSKFEAWLDIWTEVNHKDQQVIIGNQVIDCKRGQKCYSLENWMRRWNWKSKYKVKSFLTLLEKSGKLKTENMLKTTRITVCNYEIYQAEENAKKTQRKPEQNAPKTQPKRDENQLKNDKNDNNDKNEIDNAWDAFIDMRKKIRKPLTDNALKLAKEKVAGYSEDEEMQVKIINQSVLNAWQGLWPLKEENNGKAKSGFIAGINKSNTGKYSELDRSGSTESDLRNMWNGN